MRRDFFLWFPFSDCAELHGHRNRSLQIAMAFAMQQQRSPQRVVFKQNLISCSHSHGFPLIRLQIQIQNILVTQDKLAAYYSHQEHTHTIRNLSMSPGCLFTPRAPKRSGIYQCPQAVAQVISGARSRASCRSHDIRMCTTVTASVSKRRARLP